MIVQVEELLERMVGEIAVPGRYKLGTVVGQDLVRLPYSWNPWFKTERVFFVFGSFAPITMRSV